MSKSQWHLLVVGVLVGLALFFGLNLHMSLVAPRTAAAATFEQELQAYETRLSIPTNKLSLNSSCVEASSGNISILLPFRESQPQRDVWIPLRRDENATGYVNDDSTSWAVCAFQSNRPFADHLPHTMQQLYKCFSYWQAVHSPERVPILLNNIKVNSNFVEGFLAALQDVFGVQWIRQNEPCINKESCTFPYTNEAIQPAPEPAYAFLSSAHARELSRRILWHYHRTTPSACLETPRIGILNRAQRRKFLNVETLRDALEANYKGSIVHIAYFERSEFMDQVRFFASHDIIISPHGAQLTGIPFLPSCSGVLEVFPAKYYVQDYFQRLAQSSNVSHATLYLSNSDDPVRETTVARESGLVGYYRNANLCPPLSKVLEGVTTLLDLHRQCCLAVAG